MSMLLEMLAQSMGPGQIERLGKSIGTDKQTAGNLLEGALPLIMKAMKNNVRDPQQASMLEQDIALDGQGSILDNLDGFLDTPPTSRDQQMVDNLFGSRRSNVEQGLGALGGVDAGLASKLLPMVAPMIMSMLNKGSSASGGSLADFLGQEERAVRKQAPNELGMLGSLLDSDGDGQVADDLASMGGKLLGSLFGGK